MLKSSLQIDENDAAFADIRQLFLHHYQTTLHQDTDYFPGMADVLTQLDDHQIPWGIVTNKLTYLTEPLIHSFGLTQRCQCIVCGDTLPQRKPDPAPLLYACELTNVDPQQAVYVGDTEVDVTAAKAADMMAIAALYGYHDPSISSPDTWDADYFVTAPLQILDMLI